MIMSAVTLQGHPVEGWRYWRVYSNGTNDVVIETGAADLPGPGAKSFWGYYYFQPDQVEIWHQYLEYILSNIKTSGLDPNATEGHNLATSPEGEWNAEPQSFILNMLCQAPQGEWCD